MRDRHPPRLRGSHHAPTPLFTRHTRGAIEAERDGRRQRRAHGANAHPETSRERTASAAATQAHLDMERWIDEGGLVPFEAAALLRATTSRR
jgi:hypothetical protein